ncbi:type III-B CRISPR module RAMP protein Cmr1 [bacterium]|nr:type III-B CRISPR module RAMP protein Cmr1 [bacterium]
MIQFVNVKLVTPAICGGAKPRELDESHVLRPPEIRGMLRFWTRALANGAGLDMRQCEAELFGSTNYGQKLGILPVIMSNLKNELELFPHKTRDYVDNHRTEQMIQRLLQRYDNDSDRVSKDLRSKTEMILAGDHIISLRFRLDNLEKQWKDKFIAVLWTWLHLGAIGRRSRRGYGSLVWEPNKNDLLSEKFNFNSDLNLLDESSLLEYLKSGLAIVESIWGAPKNSTRKSSHPTGVFKLAAIDQVFVGHVLKDDAGNSARYSAQPDGMQAIIHGMHVDTRSSISGEKEEMGFVRGRNNKLSSPMLWRLFPCAMGFVPVMTWSPKNVITITSGTAMYTYLYNKLGFKKSLLGNTL